MKVYSYIRMGWDVKTQAYKTIESTFEEYHGKVAQCFGFLGIGAAVLGGAVLGGLFGGSSGGGGTTINVPEPTETEQNLQREQLNILQQQQARTKQLDPHVLRSMGLIKEDDKREGGTKLPGIFSSAVGSKTIPGKIRSMTKDEWLGSMTPPEKEAYELQLAQREMQMAQGKMQLAQVDQQKLMYEFQQEQWQAQQDQWKRAETETAAMKPFLLESMGLVEEDGVYRQQTEEERLAQMSTLERGQYNLTLQAQERQRKAYAGKLPISPALEESLGKQEAQIAEALSQRLGANWQLTTPGQQAMGAFSQRADLLREEARRGEISTQGGLLLANMGYLGQAQAQQTGQRGLFSQGGQIPYVQSMQQMGGMQDFGGTSANYAAYPQMTSGLFSNYGILQQPYQQQRQLQLQASMYNQQAKTQQAAGLWGGLGSLAGAGLQAYGLYSGMA